jgi:hypothetical protein
MNILHPQLRRSQAQLRLVIPGSQQIALVMATTSIRRKAYAGGLLPAAEQSA